MLRGAYAALAVALGLIAAIAAWKTFSCGEISLGGSYAERKARADRDLAVRPTKDNIQHLLRHVENKYKSLCEKMLLGESAAFSQGYQDWYIYHNYFRGRRWGEGFYLDIGTNNPLKISNTAFF